MNPYKQLNIRPNGNIPKWVIALYVLGLTALGAGLALVGIYIAKGGL